MKQVLDCIEITEPYLCGALSFVEFLGFDFYVGWGQNLTKHKFGNLQNEGFQKCVNG